LDRESSEQKYKEYISKLSDIVGRCAEHTLAMQQEFPELSRVAGHYDCPIQGKRPHWWLVTPSGEVVDPTVSQFFSRGAFVEYIPLDESKEQPTGRCFNCGGDAFKYSYFCSPACGDSAAET
jgi:hypothetical protein